MTVHWPDRATRAAKRMKEPEWGDHVLRGIRGRVSALQARQKVAAPVSPQETQDDKETTA